MHKIASSNLFHVFIIFCFITTTSMAGDFSIRQKMPLNVNAGSEFTIETLVKKKSISSFGKFTQELPAGFTAVPEQVKGGTFSFSDNTVKIIWISLPADTEFSFTYKVKVDASISGIQTVDGKFNYVDGIEKRTADLSSKLIHVKPSLTATLTQNINPAPEPKTTVKVEEAGITGTGMPAAANNPSVNTSSLASGPSRPADVSNTSPVANKIKDVSEKKENVAEVYYKVQLGAFSKKLAVSHFSGLKEISSTEENGVFKYYTGSFKTMEEAQKRKEEVISKGYKGAYVVKGAKDGKTLK